MDEPHVEGRRVSVRRLRALVEERGLKPRETAESLDVHVSDVYRALAYYHDNPDEMREVEAERRRRVEASLANGAVAGPEDV